MKFRRGDKVCALLVANKWGVDFTAFMGKLVKIEDTGTIRKATIKVTRYYSLYEMQRHKPKEFCLDIRVFKLLKWDDASKAEVIALRNASRTLHKMTARVRAM